MEGISGLEDTNSNAYLGPREEAERTRKQRDVNWEGDLVLRIRIQRAGHASQSNQKFKGNGSSETGTIKLEMAAIRPIRI